jgi:hypothetical protein
MQLDLKNVRVTYTLKEVVLAIGTILGLAGHVIRTEMQHSEDAQQIVKLAGDVAKCQQELSDTKRRAGL